MQRAADRSTAMSAATRFGRPMLAEWSFDPGVTYLNHGTVGVTPRRIMAVQQAIRDEIERHPSRFMLRALTETEFGRPLPEPPRLRAAADAGGRVPRRPRRRPRLRGQHHHRRRIRSCARSRCARATRSSSPISVYGGVLRAALFAARERGATVRTVEMPYPFRADQLADAYANAVGPKTRLAIVEHITAQSALVFPLRETAARLRARGVAVLADGAHAPGQIPVDIPSLGVDWYVANLHKWAWTPRSSGILWAAPERQAELRPTVISWGLDKGFKAEFDMLGTRDPSAHLSAPAAIALMREWGLEDDPGLQPRAGLDRRPASGGALADHVRRARSDDRVDGDRAPAGGGRQRRRPRPRRSGTRCSSTTPSRCRCTPSGGGCGPASRRRSTTISTT